MATKSTFINSSSHRRYASGFNLNFVTGSMYKWNMFSHAQLIKNILSISWRSSNIDEDIVLWSLVALCHISNTFTTQSSFPMRPTTPMIIRLLWYFLDVHLMLTLYNRFELGSVQHNVPIWFTINDYYSFTINFYTVYINIAHFCECS